MPAITARATHSGIEAPKPAEGARWDALEALRENGVSDFPAPDAPDDLTNDAVANGSSVDTSTAAFTQALNRARTWSGGRLRDEFLGNLES